jgi:hypothetical protein
VRSVLNEVTILMDKLISGINNKIIEVGLEYFGWLRLVFEVN